MNHDLESPEANALRHAWYPRFHACSAVGGSMVYLKLRKDAILDWLSLSPQGTGAVIYEEVTTWLFMLGALAGVIVFFSVRLKLTGGSDLLFPQLTAEDFRLRYYKPYLVPVAGIFVLELFMWIS